MKALKLDVHGASGWSTILSVTDIVVQWLYVWSVNRRHGLTCGGPRLLMLGGVAKDGGGIIKSSNAE